MLGADGKLIRQILFRREIGAFYGELRVPMDDRMYYRTLCIVVAVSIAMISSCITPRKAFPCWHASPRFALEK
jgi:hypothetical protein